MSDVLLNTWNTRFRISYLQRVGLRGNKGGISYITHEGSSVMEVYPSMSPITEEYRRE